VSSWVIESLKGLATPAIALAGILIACAQLRITGIRLTHDLFERRYAIYDAARTFIQIICQKHTTTVEERSLFYYKTGNAIFVLDKKLAAYLDELGVRGTRAAQLHEKIGMNKASQSEIEERYTLVN
jgi:hypothetical protein